MADDRKLIRSVYDIPDWLAENLPALTGPARTVYNSMRLPVDAGADALRSGAHGALGLEEAEPGRYSGETAGNISRALGDIYAPVRAGANAVREGAGSVLNSAREALISQGAVPRQAARAQPASAPAAPDVRQEGMVADAPPRAPRPPAMRVASSPMGDGTTPVSTRPRGGPVITKDIPQQSPQTGALETGRDIHDETGTPDLQQPGALGGPSAPRKSLHDALRERIAAIEKGTGEKLTPEQKSELQMDFFLRMMSAGSKPGANFIGAAGESGLATSSLSRGMRDKNKVDARQKRNEQRDDVFREITMMDKDADNVRAERGMGITEDHYRNMDKRDAERLRIFAKQIEQGKWRVVNNAKTGTVVLVNQDDGTHKDTGVKYEKGAERDPRSPEIQLIEHLKKNPGDLKIVDSLRNKNKNDTDQVIELAKGFVSDIANPLPVEQAVTRAKEIVRLANGGQSVDTKPAAAANKGRVIAGPDGRFKSDGAQWVKLQ